MVLYSEIIKSKAEFHAAWLLGTGDTKKLSRREILSQNLPDLCDSIIAMVPERNRTTATKTGLYLLSLLTYGTVLIHRVQVDFLQKDAEKLKEFMKKKSFVMLLAERFEKEQLKKDRERNEVGENARSTPIVSLDDVDNLVDLAHLPFISEQIGINGDPRDFTMLDAIPNQWLEANVDLAGLYGDLQPYSHMDYTMHSTFVEGNGSDENRKAKRAAVMIRDYGDFVVPEQSSMQKLRSDFIPNYEFDQRETLPPPVVPQSIDQSIEEPLKFKQCVLVELQREKEDELPGPPPKPNQRPQTPESPNQVGDHVKIQDEVPPLVADRVPSPKPDQLPIEEPQQQLHPQFDDLDLLLGFPNEPERLSALPNSSAIENNNLPLVTESSRIAADIRPPSAKKQKLNEGEAEEVGDREMARRRPLSRPLTPVNQNELTDLHSTIRPEEINMDLDSQILDVLPQRKRSRRNLQADHEDNLEIDEAVRKALTADYSSLVKKKEDVLVNVRAVRDNALEILDTPQPISFIRHRAPEELRRMFRSCVFTPFVGHPESGDEEEKESEKSNEKEMFLSVPLWSPNRVAAEAEFNDPNFQREPFNEEYHPIGQNGTLGQLCNTSGPEILETRIEASKDQDLKFRSVNLLPTPEKTKEAIIIEDLNLDPIPIAGNLENFDFTNQLNVHNTEGLDTLRSENLENVRHRQKSSLGVRPNRTEELEDFHNDAGYRQKGKEREKHREQAMNANPIEDDLFFFSSGSLLQENRRNIHDELLIEAEIMFPEPVDFNKFTARHSRKKAAIAFEGLLLSLKNMEVSAEQKEPFGTIYVKHINHDESQL
ncbi:unnamed protein product [Caenorhabditis brenneri]